MLIFGWKYSRIKFERINDAICPSCQESDSLSALLYSKYFHIFWIPILPYKRIVEFHCANCGSSYDDSGLKYVLQKQYLDFKTGTKFPIWQFSGIILFFGIILWGIFSSQIDKKREQEYLQNPKIGDVYVYKIDLNSYSTFKIVETKGDSLILRYNSYQIGYFSNIGEIEKESNYSSQLYITPMHEIIKMYQNKEIEDIIRK
jgi:hypothetical protein